MNAFLKYAKYRIINNPVQLLVSGFISRLSKPKDELIVFVDKMKTRRRLKWLCKELDAIPSTSKKALVLSLSDSIYQVKLEAILAVGLKLAGIEVIVLTSRKYQYAHHYYKSFGINKFVYWEDFRLKYDDFSRIEKSSESLYEYITAFSDVKQLRYNNVWIGVQLLSTAARLLHDGLPDPVKPEVRNKIISLLPRSLETINRATRILDKVAPDLIYAIEANYIINGSIIDLAINKNVSVIQTIQPTRDDALIFKRLTKETRREHPGSLDKSVFNDLSNHKWDEEKELLLKKEFEDRYEGKWFLQSRNQPGVRDVTREELFDKLSLAPDKPVAVIFVPVLWDANLFYGEDLFEDYGDWYINTIKTIVENKSVNWVVKLHPANQWKRARENITSELPEIEILRENDICQESISFIYPDSDISTFSLFNIIDYGITVRGTVGMEMPCFGVTVITAGTGRYSGLGFTIDSNTKTDYLNKLINLHKQEKINSNQILLAKKHAYYVFKHRPWLLRSARAEFCYEDKGSAALDSNLIITAKTVDEINSNGDLSSWANWAVFSEKVDYISDEPV